MKLNQWLWTAGISAGLALGAGACGGGSEESAPPKAGPTDGGGQTKRGPTKEDKAKQAAKLWSDLSKRIDKMDDKAALDPAWFKSQLDAILALDPKHSAARFNVAVLIERGGDKARAVKMYEEIRDDDEDFAPAAENIAKLMVDQGEVQKAVGIYRRVVANDPTNVTSRLALARILLGEREYKEAIQLCRAALARKADAIEAFRVLAQAYRATGNLPMAELIIGRGFKVDPEDKELHYAIAQILLDRKDKVGAVDKLKHVVKLDPKWHKVRAQLADIAMEYRDFGNAAQQYEAILKEVPDHRPTKVSLGVSYKGLGRYDQAEALYTGVLASSPNDADVLWNLAVLYHKHKLELDKAEQTYTKYKQSADPNHPNLSKVDEMIEEVKKQKEDLAAIRERQEREEKKRQAVAAACQAVAAGKPAKSEAIGNEQEVVEVAWQLMVEAQTAIQNGDLAAGEKSVQCAFGITPKTPSANQQACAPMRVMWTQILYQLGRVEDASSTINEALECDPNNPDAQLIREQLDELLKQQGDAGGAEGGDAEGAAGGGQPQ